jgi:hypothetical protein
MQCSKEGLGSFRMAQLARDANLRKEAKEVLDEWLEAKSLVLLCDWVEKHRDRAD